MNRLLPLFLGIAFACGAMPVQSQALAPQTTLQPDALQWQWSEPFETASLRIVDAQGRVVDAALGRTLQWSPRTHALADGVYRYELTLSPPGSPYRRGADAAGSDAARAGGLVHAGSFHMEAGRIVPPTQETEGKRHRPDVAKDQVVADDLIVQGSACAGFDCVNNEDFGDRVMQLKENNTRIAFEDTSVDAGDPTSAWELTANDSAGGGLSRFSVLHRDSSRTSVSMLAAAPDGSLRVDDAGRLGLHTDTPAQALHLVDGDAPTIRLEQGLFGGWGESTWDLRADDTAFSVVDSTTGGTAPFNIAKGAPTASLGIDAIGVGFGTPSPASTAHVFRTDGRATIVVEDDGAPAAPRILAEIANNGDASMALHGADGGFSMHAGSELSLAPAGSTAAALALASNGDVVIPGLLTQGSSRTLKHAIEAVSTSDALRSLLQLPVYTWQYRNGTDASRHLGPMAEDVYRAFRLGIGERSLAASDVAGLALVAAQSLRETLAVRDAELDALLERLTVLEQRAEQRVHGAAP